MALLAVEARNKNKIINKLREKSPVIILGTQKTGSTVIAALLAEATGCSVTLDVTRSIKDKEWQIATKYGLREFSEFAVRYRKEFSKEIIKEPALTYFYSDLQKLFPSARFIMIQRDPIQNIRSILNRLQIPGHLSKIRFNEWRELVKTPVWRLALDSGWLGRPSSSYMRRWQTAGI